MHTIFVKSEEEEYQCREDQHLLVAMKAVGKSCIPSGCHGGGCGVCKVRILAGDVERKVMSRKHVSEEEQQQGISLACRVFPRSTVTLEIYESTTHQ
ncbi:MAG: 2Fe-2S iron-sulfur cluster binding domain-containing protein [Actinobacteria bacterium]|nr:2Fe-2S iron-sulfur cluster binding domain-containing protein [Actinomycetota bacterium]